MLDSASVHNENVNGGLSTVGRNKTVGAKDPDVSKIFTFSFRNQTGGNF